VPRWWWDQPAILLGVPATDHRAVTIDAQAQAAAGDGGPMGRRAPTVRHGQGRAARPARRATAGVGIAGLTPDDPSGTPEHGRDPHRRDFQPHLIKAVGGRTWHGHAYGPAGPTVFLTPATVAQPLQPVAAADDRRLIEPGGLPARQQPWSRQPPPQNTARAGRVHVLLTVRRFAWATA
jgi:hypothetical protein